MSPVQHGHSHLPSHVFNARVHVTPVPVLSLEVLVRIYALSSLGSFAKSGSGTSDGDEFSHVLAARKAKKVNL